MNKGLVSGLVLLVFGLVCGILLAGVNSFTAPLIVKEEQKVKYEVLGNFYNLDNYTVKEHVLDGNYNTVTVNLFGQSHDVKVTVNSVYVFTKDTDNTIDALVYAVSAYGYNTTTPIQMMIAVNKDMTIKGYQVVQQQETSGFGSKIVGRDFKLYNIDDFSQFDGIAGVTYSSKAVLASFTVVQQRVVNDFGGGLGE